MKKIFILLTLIISASLIACEKDYGTFNSDNRPTIPVTFPGTTTYGFNPYKEYSLATGGALTFTLAIPENSGRTIKEISKAAGGATGINVSNLTKANDAGAPLLNQSIAGNGTKAEFSISVADFKAKTGYTPAIASSGKNISELAFIFSITLDNGETIIPVPVRIRVVK